MDEEHSSDMTGYIVAAALGAIGGALLIAIATKALPKMMSEMMRHMMSRRGDGGLQPSEF